jgi:GMP synthase-like glutamine amidotransferase
MRALVIHHDSNSSIGLLGDVLDEAGYSITNHFVCTEKGSATQSAPFPTLGGVDLLVPLGSRWSVYDHDRIGEWITEELRLLREAHRRGIPTLGICFGAQAIAAAHGAKVKPAPQPEIGWYEVVPDGDFPAAGPWFQWHFDVFEVPNGATRLASSSVGPQAFQLDRTVAVQFHPEVDTGVLHAWIEEDRNELVAAGLDIDTLYSQTAEQVPAATQRAVELIDAFHARVF